MLGRRRNLYAFGTGHASAARKLTELQSAYLNERNLTMEVPKFRVLSVR